MERERVVGVCVRGMSDVWGLDDVGGQVLLCGSMGDDDSGCIGFLGKNKGKNGFSGVDQ